MAASIISGGSKVRSFFLKENHKPRKNLGYTHKIFGTP
jgi:hypothetical protein